VGGGGPGRGAAHGPAVAAVVLDVDNRRSARHVPNASYSACSVDQNASSPHGSSD
jgi:hypothetical protein